MLKVKIVFPSLLQLWDFKQLFRKRVLQTLCLKHSLICLCTEEEIDLAIHAYHAKVESAAGEPKSDKQASQKQNPGEHLKGLPIIAAYLFGS